jgi:hypothetical protein
MFEKITAQIRALFGHRPVPATVAIGPLPPALRELMDSRNMTQEEAAREMVRILAGQESIKGVHITFCNENGVSYSPREIANVMNAVNDFVVAENRAGIEVCNLEELPEEAFVANQLFEAEKDNPRS